MVNPSCKHKNIISYHDNSILCKDCHEIIWQGKNLAEPSPRELSERLKRRENGGGKIVGGAVGGKG